MEADGLTNPPELTLDHTLPAQSYTDTAPGGGSYWTPTAHEHYAQTVAVPPSELHQYVGSSPFGLTITIEDRGLYTASNPLAYVNDKYVISNLTLTVDYHYMPAVPLPQSGAMLAVGLGILGGVAWRRR